MTEPEKFKEIADKIMQVNPNVLTSMELVMLLLNHLAFKGMIKDSLELHTPEQIKAKADKLEEFAVNVKDYLKFRKGI